MISWNIYIKKDIAQAAKKADKERAQSDPAFVSATFDMQSVLQLPSGAESLLYCKRKLIIHNRTIYEATAPNKGYCYLWPKNAGKRGSVEIGPVLFEYIQGLPESVRHLRSETTCQNHHYEHQKDWETENLSTGWTYVVWDSARIPHIRSSIRLHSTAQTGQYFDRQFVADGVRRHWYQFQFHLPRSVAWWVYVHLASFQLLIMTISMHRINRRFHGRNGSRGQWCGQQLRKVGHRLYQWDESSPKRSEGTVWEL